MRDERSSLRQGGGERCLVVPLVFKTSVGPRRSWVGSIPIRLRHYSIVDCGLMIADSYGAAVQIRSPQSAIAVRRGVMEKRRAALSLLLVAVGTGLLLYGLLCWQSTVVSSGEPTQGQPAVQSELALVQEVARGRLKREESGQIKKTYEEGGKAPAACPT